MAQLQVISIGNENDYIMNAAYMTRSMFYDYKIATSNFAMESVTTTFKGKTHDLHATKELTLELEVPRIADLVHKMIFSFDLPDVFVRQHPLEDPVIDPGNESIQNAVKEKAAIMRWIDHIGAAMILSARIEIGGNIVQELTGNMIDIYHHTRLSAEQLQAYYELIGHVPELNTVSSEHLEDVFRKCGRRNDATTGGNMVYTSAKNTGNGEWTFLNSGYRSKPFIRGRRIYVPLPFWFHNNIAQCLPLICLDKQPVYVRLVLRPIRDLYLTGALCDLTLEKASIAYNENENYVYNTYYADEAPRARYHRGFVWSVPTHTNQELYRFTGLESNSWPLNPALEITYISLDAEQQLEFKTSSIYHLIDRVYTETFLGVGPVQQNVLQLNSKHLCRELFVIAQREDIASRNAWTNYGSHDEEIPEGQDETMLYRYQASMYTLATLCGDARKDVLALTLVPDALKQAATGGMTHLVLFDPSITGQQPPHTTLLQAMQTIHPALTPQSSIMLHMDEAYTFKELRCWNDVWRFRAMRDIPAITNSNISGYRSGIITNMAINMNGEARLRAMGEAYFTQIQSLSHHSSSPRSARHILMYSFAEMPEDKQPTGSANFTTLGKVELLVTVKPSPPGVQLGQRYSITTFSVCHQILTIVPGKGLHLMFGQ